MRRMTQVAKFSAIICLAVGCGACGHDALKEGHSGQSVALPDKQIDLGDGITLEMVLIPAGEFVMGSSESEREGPEHRVRITRPFYLGKYPVTQEQWVALMGRNPSRESIGRRKPVTRVSWTDCQRFIDRLNERMGDAVGTFRLPTEAEWEYACRAGTTTRYSFGDDADRLGDYAWYSANSGGRTHPVGQKKPNPWGLYDMHGNVYEWCADWFDLNYYAKSPVDDPRGPESGSRRVLRGGSWLYEAPRCRSACRNGEGPTLRDYDIGFRLALVPAEGRTTKPETPVEPLEVDKQPSATDPADLAGPWKLPPDAPEPAIAPFDAGQARRHQKAWAEHLGRPVEITNSIGMKLRLIPPGEFMMGSPEWDEEGRESDESPQHLVRITRPFYFGVYEVTQGEYKRVMGTNPSAFSKDGSRSEWVSGLDTSRFPVEQVSWQNAVEFCERLSALPAERSARREYRLPTEAEWEYACRAGTTTPFHFGSVLDGRQANVQGSYPLGTERNAPRLGRTTTVGSYSPNAFGLHDMHGNVAEWCADWADWGPPHAPTYYARSPVNDPTGPSSGHGRVSRGGSYDSIGARCRSAVRKGGMPHLRVLTLGFRVVLVPVGE